MLLAGAPFAQEQIELKGVRYPGPAFFGNSCQMKPGQGLTGRPYI